MKMITILLMMVMITSFVVAEQTVKTVEYPIGYVAQATINTDYIQEVHVQSPDGIDDILSLEIKLTGDFQANTGISARVNIGGSLVSCSPSTWTTPNIDAPNYEISFDCTDLVNQHDWKGGSQQFGFRTDAIAQNIYGTMKITYYNKPEVSMSLFGTEYQVGDAGVSFIQLLDDNRQAVNDASCYIDAYYPNKTHLWDNAQLTYQSNSDGLYYKDFIVPDVIGLYMLSSACYVPASAWEDTFNDYSLMSSYENITVSSGVAKISEPASQNYRWATTSISCPKITGEPNADYQSGIVGCIGEDFDMTDVEVTGTYDVQLIFSWKYDNALIDDIFLSTYCYDSDGCSTFTTLETFNVTNNNTPFNYVPSPYGVYNLYNLNYTDILNLRIATDYTKLGGGDGTVDIDAVGIKILFPQTPIENGYIYSEEIVLSNESGGWQTFNATYDDNGETINFWITDLSNNTLCTGLGNIEICAGTTSPIKLYTELSRVGTNSSPELDFWIVTWLVNGTIREVKGAGEIHITNHINEINTNIDAVAEDVWSWEGNISTNILDRFASYFWNWTGTISTFIKEAFSNTIWTRPDRNLTYYEDVTDYNKIVNDTWNFENRTITGQDELWIGGTEYSPDEEVGKVVVRLVNALDLPVENADCSLKIFYPNNTLYLQMNMTEYVSPANETGAGGIYLADFNHSGEVGVHPYGVDCYAEVGTTPKRYFLLDTYHVFGANRTEQAREVWEYNTRTLTDYNQTAQLDLTNYTLVQELVSTYGNDLTAQLIWEYANRNLTYYPTQLDLTNYTLIDNLIALYENNLTAQEIWDYSDRNLTFFPAQLDLTNYTLMQSLVSQYGNDLTAGLIWSYANRNLTYYPVDTDLTNYTLVESLVASYSNNITSQEIWEYANRNLTYYAPTISAQDVWTYTDRNLTYYEHQDLTNYNLIQTIVWNATVRTLTDFNFTVNINESLVADAVWTAVNRTLSEFPDLINESLIANTVWDAVNRTLTDYNQSDLTDYDLIQEMVWNNTARTLTYYPTPNNLSASDVWSYGTRELTYYPTTNLTLSNDSIQALGNAVWNYNGTINDNLLTQIGTKVQCYIDSLLNINDGEWGINILAC